jgi:hypothetical protein
VNKLFPLPFIPSHQGRGLFGEIISSAIEKFWRLACLPQAGLTDSIKTNNY